MELKNAFILVMVCFCFLIGYSYAEADEHQCNKHYYIDEEGTRHCDEIDGVVLDLYLNQSLAKYESDHNICFIDFTGPYFDKSKPKMACKHQSALTKEDGKALYANSSFAQLRKEEDLEYFFLTFAAALDDPQANFNLGMVHYNGFFNQPQNLELAFQYMLTAAIEGYPKAMHNVAEMKLIGDGTEKDLVASFNWYKQAAQYDLVNSNYMLGKMYEMGWGVDQSNKNAFDSYLKAAVMNDAGAMVRMATLITKDNSLGFKYIDSILLIYLAKHAEIKDAQMAFTQFIEQGVIDNQDIQNMNAWFQETCNQDNLGGCVAHLISNQIARF